MNRKEKEEIKDSIRMCLLRLQTIKPHLNNTKEKPMLNETFNKLLIEKAVLKEKLSRREPSFLKRVLSKIQTNNKKELICDYFKTSKV